MPPRPAAISHLAANVSRLATVPQARIRGIRGAIRQRGRRLDRVTTTAEMMGSAGCSRSAVLYIIFILFPFTCLVPPLLPDASLIQTKFDGLSNLTIGDSQGVTKIQWGIWKACYDHRNGTQCTSTGLESLKHSFQHPYTFIIRNENNPSANVTVKGWWVRSMHLQFFSVILAFLPTFLLGNCGMQRGPYGYYRFICRRHHGLIEDDEEHSEYNRSHKGRNKLFLYAIFPPMVTLLAMFGLYIGIIRSIEKEMKTLGAASVNTHALLGFGLTMFAALYLVLGGLCISCMAHADIKMADRDSGRTQTRNGLGCGVCRLLWQASTSRG